MSNLQQRQEKIQAKRKQTPWRDFVRDRLSWRPMLFYKNSGLISRYPESRVNQVVSFKEFNLLRDGLCNNEDLSNSNISFFDLLGVLFFDTTKRNLMHYSENENSNFSDGVLGAKNSYLSMVVIKDIENVMYSLDIRYNCTNVFNSVYIYNDCGDIYQSAVVIESSQIFFSKNILNSNSIWFSSNLIGCHDCVGCRDLQQQSYCINNIQYTKEEYQKLKRESIYKLLGSDNNTNQFTNYGSINCLGSFIHNCENVQNGIMVSGLKNGRNLILSGSPYQDEECYDSFIVGRCKHIYGCEELGNHSEHIYLSTHVFSSSHCFYCFDIEGCSFCLGCIGLKNKSYCILNKQYSKEERYEKVDEIFTKMEQDGQLGEFFPASMNPFYFNDTAAYLIDPSFTKEEVTKLGYLRRDEPIKVDIPEGAITVKSSDLGQFESTDEQGNWKLDETVCKRVILDENGDAYRIIPMELEFLQQHGLPLPRKHWLTRMKEIFCIN